MKKLFYIGLAALSLSACEIAKSFNEDFILPPSQETIIQVVNATYLEEVLTQMEGLQEILYYIQTGNSQTVHKYGSNYEVDHISGVFKQDRDSKNDPLYWRCDLYYGALPAIKFVSEGDSWTVRPVDEKKYQFFMRIKPAEDRSVNGATFEVNGIRPDESGPYNVKFGSTTPMKCRWFRSNYDEGARILNLEGTMHYDFRKGETVIESFDRKYEF